MVNWKIPELNDDNRTAVREIADSVKQTLEDEDETAILIAHMLVIMAIQTDKIIQLRENIIKLAESSAKTLENHAQFMKTVHYRLDCLEDRDHDHEPPRDDGP